MKKIIMFLFLAITFNATIYASAADSSGGGCSVDATTLTGDLYRTISETPVADALDSTILLEGYGMKLNANDYSKVYECKKEYNLLYYGVDGACICTYTTKIFVLESIQKSAQRNIYDTWMWTEISPESYVAPSRFNTRQTYYCIPDDMILQSYLSNDMSYQSSSPKTAVVSTSYTVGGTGEANGASMSATVTTVKNSLEIYNKSNSSKNLVKLLYDFETPNNYSNSGVVDYLKSTTEHLGRFIYVSDNKTNTLGISFTLKLGYAKKNGFFYSTWSNSECGLTTYQFRTVTIK